MFKFKPVAFLLGSIAFSGASIACMNDRDTLAFELRNRPDVQRALTGRFDRYPPLYYSMRVDRLMKKGSLTPDEYDDLAVALGRLGRNKEGLEVLRRKAALKTLTSIDMYRLHANRGTLLAHDWIHEGAKKESLNELQQAEKDIETAIKINPKAHFGREGAQLETIKWLIALKQGKTKDTLADWVEGKLVDAKPAESFSGLIMLGGAWESPDVALAIARLSELEGKHAVLRIATFRYQELIKLGRKSFTPKEAEEETESNLTSTADMRGAEGSESHFKSLRAEANQWLARKTEFMLGRLRSGHHPDTDSDFWKGWREPALPPVPHIPYPTAKEEADRLMKTVFMVGRGVGALIIGIPVIYWLRKRKRQATR